MVHHHFAGSLSRSPACGRIAPSPERREERRPLAEFIRELIASGTREGLNAARARGRVGGQPTVATPEIIRAARDMLPNLENSIAKILGTSLGTLYNHIPDLQEIRASGRVSKQITGG
ncbi:hypothetical protein [Kitasatospora sp. NPDC093679]|uniref:hypothetical protein n=1 Tax=Kitasatospora sp. NPDC093679 TaxID=3154983 RepID=UPI00343D5B94